MKPFRNRLRDALAPLIPVVQVALITAAAIGNVLIAAAIFLNAKKLGALFLPALALYFVLLTVLLAAILRRRELAQLHALVGDEQFYEWYPRQRRRDERHRARMKRALEKHDRKARRKEPKRIPYLHYYYTWQCKMRPLRALRPGISRRAESDELRMRRHPRHHL